MKFIFSNNPFHGSSSSRWRRRRIAGAAWKVQVGIPWTEKEFAELATGIPHPFSRDPVVPEEISLAIFNILTMGALRHEGEETPGPTGHGQEGGTPPGQGEGGEGGDAP